VDNRCSIVGFNIDPYREPMRSNKLMQATRETRAPER
jgi:hypothetical protein